MVKEAKDIDFYTTGRQPSEHDFIRISEWIKIDKRKDATRKSTRQPAKQKITSPNISFAQAELKC